MNKTIIIVSVYLQYMYIDSLVWVVHLVKKVMQDLSNLLTKVFI